MYKDAAPATLALLEQRCSEVTDDMLRMDMNQATSVVAHLRKAARFTPCISHEVSLIQDEKKAENMDGYVGFHALLYGTVTVALSRILPSSVISN